MLRAGFTEVCRWNAHQVNQCENQADRKTRKAHRSLDVRSSQHGQHQKASGSVRNKAACMP